MIMWFSLFTIGLPPLKQNKKKTLIKNNYRHYLAPNIKQNKQCNPYATTNKTKTYLSCAIIPRMNKKHLDDIFFLFIR